MDNDEIDFVARHYRENCFKADRGWQRLGFKSVSYPRIFRAAAAVALGAVLTASAALLYREFSTDRVQPESTTTEMSNSLATVKVIDFDNASLPAVIEKIEEVYDVKVENLPEAPEGYTLSLHYEGSPTDLIQTINENLGTGMTVNEK